MRRATVPLCVLLVWLACALPAAALVCPPGTFYWVLEGIERCRLCQPGCACPGGFAPCAGCSGGFFSAAPGAASCAVCPPGTTTEVALNAGCDPLSAVAPCQNDAGPLGYVSCHPVPPEPRTAAARPREALAVPPQYLPGGPPFVPNVVPPYYDVDGRPLVQQSY
jgi:hypothetical protein